MGCSRSYPNLPSALSHSGGAIGGQMAQRLITLLCTIAVAVNALLPSGFMLARAQSADAVTVVICTGYGPETLTLDSEGHQLPPEPQKEKRCDYATFGAVALASEPARLETQALYASISYRITRAIFRETPKPGATSARGPPIEMI